MLGDEADRTQTIRDYHPKMSGVAQVEALFQAANQFVGARGNRVWTVSFALERTHADLATAVNFLASHPAALPDYVDLKVEQQSTVLYLAGAVWTSFDGLPEGRSTVCSYSFTGPSYLVGS